MSKAAKTTAKAEKTNVIDRDAFDDILFDSVKEYQAIDELCSDESAEGIVQDAFNSFHKLAPKLSESASGVQADVFRTLMDLPEYKETQALSKLNEITSGLALTKFVPELLKQVSQAEEQLEKAQAEAKKNGQPVPQGLEDGGMSEGQKAAMRGALRKALEKAQEEAEKFEGVAASWGMEKGKMENVPYAERMALAQQIAKTEKLRKISDLVGRFVNVADAENAKSPSKGYDEIVDITVGNDLSRVLPSELAKLAEDEDQFFADFLERKLLQYRVAGEERVAKGPLIVCMDQSGSMRGFREEWAKAVTLALMHLAEQQNRAFGFIGFDSQVVRTNFFPAGQPATAQEKIAIATEFSGGGTDFWEPLQAAMKMREANEELKPCDIVFITDGMAYLSPEQVELFKQFKQEQNVRVYGVAVQDGGYVEIYATALEPFCDNIAEVNSLGEINFVRGVMATAAASDAQ